MPVHATLDSLWQMVGDWGNVGWVMGATSVELLSPVVRTIYFGADAPPLTERLVAVDDAKHTLTYEIYGGNMGTSMYQGTVQLDATSASTTQLSYVQKYIPVSWDHPLQFRDALTESFLQRLAWVQKTFDSRQR
jgi:hypothetical protein